MNKHTKTLLIKGYTISEVAKLIGISDTLLTMDLAKGDKRRIKFIRELKPQKISNSLAFQRHCRAYGITSKNVAAYYGLSNSQLQLKLKSNKFLKEVKRTIAIGKVRPKEPETGIRNQKAYNPIIDTPTDTGFMYGERVKPFDVIFS